jgi:hypothetical protein
MPSLVALRTCNAAIPASPLQGVAPNATQLARGSSSHWDRTLAAPHRGHASSASPALTRSQPLSQALGRSRRPGCTPTAGMEYLLGELPIEQPLLFALGAAMLPLTFAIEIEATAFGRRCMR